jgi:hypothetical protein
MLFRRILEFLSTTLIFFAASNAWGQVFIPMTNWNCKANSLSLSQVGSGDFTQGTLSNTTLSANGITLSAGQSTGTYTSQAIDFFGGCYQPLGTWLDFLWSTSLPFGKELPMSAESAVDYSNISTGLTTNLILYLKMNETAAGTAPGGKDFKDESATGDHGTRVGTPTMGATGRLLGAVTTSSGNYIDLGTTLGSLGTGDVTQAAWIKTSSTSAGVVINNRDVAAQRTLSLHIGWWAGASKGNGLAYFSNDGPSCEVGAIGNTNLADGNWHHIVGVRQSVTNYMIYVDGVVQGTNNITIGSGCNSSAADSPASWQVGRHGGWATTFAGSIDELMMWNRALTATEVQKLFQRGGNRLKFQIRACTQRLCADAPAWQGPDGTSSTYFTEINNNSIPTTGLGTVLVTSPSVVFANFPSVVISNERFFQYRVTLETDNSTISPDLKSFIVNQTP